MRTGSRQSASPILLAALLGCAICIPASASAKESIRLTAGFTPEHLGHRTSLKLAFEIMAPAGQVPSPVTEVNLRYPRNLGWALTGLGTADCTAAILAADGPAGCPTDSVMGLGTAAGEIAFGPEIIQASAIITVLRTADEGGHLAMLFNVFAADPVQTEFVIPGVLLSGPVPYGGHIDLHVPLVPSLPEAPDVAATKIAATIGPADGVQYTERVRGRTIRYRPKGIPLPPTCPRGGFRFGATFAFQDGTTATARTRVPCPRPTRRRHA